MTNKFKILTVLLVLIIAGASWHFRGNLFKIYQELDKKVQQLEKVDLENTIGQVKVEIFTPAPLKIGGKENQNTFAKEKVIAQTNIQRYNNGMLNPLIENEKLYKVALAKAQDMFEKQYFDHVSPSLVGPGELAKNFGYDYIIEGENLILGNFSSEEEMVNHWMASPGHRANILNKRFADIGIVVIKGTYKGETVWIGVQEFGLSLAACIQPSNSTRSQIEINKNALDQLSKNIDLLKIEIDNSKEGSGQYNKLADEYNKLVIKYNELVGETKNVIAQYNDQVTIFNSCVVGE